MADPTPTYATVTLQGPLMFDTWTTATRPTTPLVGATGLNTDLSEVETWSGSGWTTKVVSVVGSAGVVTLGELVSGGVAPLASPALTGSPTAPTPTTSDNSTLIATTAYVTAKVASTTSGVSTVNGRSGAITLALSDIPGAAPLASPTFTGSPAAPTPTTDDNDTSIATTAYVLGQLSAAPPVMDGSATVGVSTRIARADHVHPTDTSRYAASNPAAYQTAGQVIAVLPTAATALPLMDGAASVGIGTTWARADHAHPTDMISVKRFGAKVDGLTDDTAAFQAALEYAASVNGAVSLPAGTCIVSSLNYNDSTKNLAIHGAGRGASFLKTNSATANVLQLTVSMLDLADFTIGTTVTRTSGGSGLLSNSNVENLRSIGFDGQFRGITGQGGGGVWRDLLFTNPALNATGIVVNGYGAGLNICDAEYYNGSFAPSCGIQIVNSGDVIISNCSIVGQGTDLLINPGSGQTVASVFATNTFFDTATTGVNIAPSGTGSVVRVRFDACWMCSHTGNGVTLTNSGSGLLQGIHFLDCMMCFNGSSGLSNGVTGGAVQDVTVLGGTFAGNIIGVNVGAGQCDFSILGASLGAYAGGSGNSSWGVVVNAGASDRYIIANNRTTGNGTGGITDGGTGGNKYLAGNIPATGTSSLGSPGWKQNPDGTIEQWGVVTTASNGLATVTFPRPFPTAVLRAGVFVADTTPSGLSAARGALTTTTMTVVLSNSGAGIAGAVAWEAMGN